MRKGGLLALTCVLLCACGLEYVQVPVSQKLNAALFIGYIDAFWEDTSEITISTSGDGKTYQRALIRDRMVIRDFVAFLNNHLGGWEEVPTSDVWSVHNTLMLEARRSGSRFLKFDENRLFTGNNAGVWVSRRLSAADADTFAALISSNPR